MYFLAALAAVTGLALLPAPVGPGPEIGRPAPAFTLVDAQGKKHSLAEYKGKMVVLEFVNITCPSAWRNYEADSISGQLGNIPQLQKHYAAKGVVWLSIIITKKQQDEGGGKLISATRAKTMANDMVQKYGATPTATLIDLGGSVGAAYATRTSMHVFVVDRKGVLVYDGALDDRDGELSDDRQNFVAAALDETLAGKPVAMPKTMPYGCHAVARPHSCTPLEKDEEDQHPTAAS